MRLPFSVFRRLRLLHSLTEQTDKTIAATKNKDPPTQPATIALSLDVLVKGPGTSKLISLEGAPMPSGECEKTLILLVSLNSQRKNKK